MTALRIDIDLDNACFEGDDIARETAKALQHLAGRIEEQTRSYLAGNGSRMRVADSNGNTIGFAIFDIPENVTDDEEE